MQHQTYRQRFSSLRQLRASRVVNPTFSIAVRIRNEVANLPHLMASLQRQVFEEPVEIVFLDSGSTDGSIEYLQTQDCTIYQIAPHEFAYGSTCNLMMELTSAPYVLFLSGHVELVEADIFHRIAGLLASEGDCAAVLRQIPNERVGVNAYDRGHLAHRFRSLGDRPIRLGNRPLFSNAASLVPRSAWEAGPFPDVIFSEDALWAASYADRGGKVFYLPMCTVRHSHGYSADDTYRRVAMSVRARYGRRFSPLQALYYFAGVFLTVRKHGGSLEEAFAYATAHGKAYVWQ